MAGGGGTACKDVHTLVPGTWVAWHRERRLQVGRRLLTLRGEVPLDDPVASSSSRGPFQGTEGGRNSEIGRGRQGTRAKELGGF